MVTPDENGHLDAIWTTTLIQCLRLSIGESPFYADYGIPAQQSVIQQIFPDFFVAQTQRQFAQYFATITVAKVQSATPTYNIVAMTFQGTKLDLEIPI